MRIIVDVFGGDHAPIEILKGCAMAVQEYGVPEDEVRKLMKDTDKARANYYAYHTGRKWGEHVNYSLSIDSGYIEIEDIVDLIVQYTKVRRFSQA